ncbi:MAG: HD domain-containing protein [Candidatus Berkelbacteria bacterium]
MIDPVMKKAAIDLACEITNKCGDVMHGVSHLESVLNYSNMIVKSYPEADLDILEISVWWHDVGRLYLDRGHALKSMEMAIESLTKIGFDASDVEKISIAIESHSNSSEKKPSTIEGIILKDADKLDFLTSLRWQIGMDNDRTKEIEIGIDKIPLILTDILILPESKEIYAELFTNLVNYLKKSDNPFINKYKPTIAKRWQVNI